MADLRVLPTLYVALPFNGREQRHEIHRNRKLYETAPTARSIITRTKYGPFTGTGRVLIVDLNMCEPVDEPRGLYESFLLAEQRTLYWGQEAARIEALLHGKQPELALK